MILIGLAIILFGVSALGDTAELLEPLVARRVLPQGLAGRSWRLQIVMFAFLGVELIGVTAGEAQNPEKTIPSAINKVIWRILIFYIGAADGDHVAGRLESLRPREAPSWWCSTAIGIPAPPGSSTSSC